ncbi:MAG: hypothetical protein AAF206_27745 [Bacteroidota bacterium]
MNSRWWLIIWGCALLLQLARSHFFFSWDNSDRNLQIQATANFVAGHGISVASVDPHDLSKTTYQRLSRWPVGYSLLLAPIYLLTGDWMIAAEGLHLLGILLLFVMMARWWLHLDIHSNRWAPVYFFLPWAISFAPFQFLGTTDLWSGLLVLWGSLMLLKDRKWTAILLFSGAVMLRYACYPLLLLPAIWFWRNRNHRMQQVLAGTGLFVLFFALQQYQSEAGGYFAINENLPTTERLFGFFPQQLLRFDNFFLKSYLFVYFPKLSSLSGIGEAWLKVVGWGVSATLISGIWKQKKYIPDNLISLTFFLTVLMAGLLILFSAVIPAEEWGREGWWTYVEESRYFFVLMVLFQFLIAMSLGMPWQNRWKKYVILLLFLFLTSLGGIHNVQRISRNQKEIDSPLQRTERDMKDVYHAISNLYQKGHPIIYLYGSQYEWYEKQMAATWGGARMMSETEWGRRHDLTKQKEPIYLIVDGVEIDSISRQIQILTLDQLLHASE